MNKLMLSHQERNKIRQMLMDAEQLNKQFFALAKGKDCRIIGIAAVALLSQIVATIPDPAAKFDFQERTVKSVIKATEAPFTVYKLGQ